MLTKEGDRHVIDMLFVLALFALFALSGVLLIAIGANIYQSNVDRMEENYALRTTGAYISEKVRRSDLSEPLAIGEIDGAQALLLREEINDISYTTYLYLHDDYLTELFGRSDLALPASAGQPITQLQALEFSLTDETLLRVQIVEKNGRSHELLISPRYDAAQ